MSFLLSVFDAQVNNLLEGDTDLLSLLARYRNITSAVEKYSGDAPDVLIAEVTGDGGQYYPIASNLSGWVEGQSDIISVEYPAATIASDEAPTYLDDDDYQDDFWALASGTQTRYLYLPTVAPPATDTMRIAYTAPYGWSASGVNIAVSQEGHGFSVNDYVYLDGSTYYAASNVQIATHQVTAVADADNCTVQMLVADVPPADFFAVCHWAAGLCCVALAAKFAKAKDSTLAVDSATHTPKSDSFAARAQDFFDLYNLHMGIGQAGADTLRAAQQFVDWDTAPEWPSGRRFLFRSRR